MPARGSSSVARPGQELSQLRAPLESVFGHDFSNVRLHRGGLADANRARAVTLGDDVHVASSEGNLSAPGAHALVAHELAHVIQQRRLIGNSARSPADLEREAEDAATAASTGRRATVKGSVAAAGSTPQLAPKLAPAPPSGNILYVGMNNADPEVKSLLGRYPSGSSVDVTVIKATEEQSATAVGGTTFDLTGDAGIEALAKSLTSEAARQAALARTLKAQAKDDRDDLAHVAKVYADTEADGKDRMTRVVLSGHSGGMGVLGSSGEVYFSALVELAGVFPKAAGQTKHLIVAGCHTGDEGTILDYYIKAYPTLLTVWAWWDACPTGAGAAAAITTWARLTEHGETTLPKQGGAGIATWSGGVYQGSPSAKAPASSVLSSVRSDDARFQEYLDGTRAEGPHGGWLEAYYGRVFGAARRPDITGADHDEMEQKRQRALLLRFWKNVAKHFSEKNGAAIAKGYGTATVPDYANLSRKDTLKAIAAFATTATGTAADKGAAATLLDGLKNLDPKVVPDSMLAD